MLRFSILVLSLLFFTLKTVEAGTYDNDHSLISRGSRVSCVVKSDEFWLQSYSIIQSVQAVQLTMEGLKSELALLREKMIANNGNKFVVHTIKVHWDILKTLYALKKIPYCSDDQDTQVSVDDSALIDQVLKWNLNSYEKLQFFKKVVPINLLSEDEWQRIFVFAQSFFTSKKPSTNPIKSTYAYDVEQHGEHSCFVTELRDMWPEVRDSLLPHINKDDVVVSVGNTPTYLTEMLKIHDQSIKVLTVAMSGHPGIARRFDVWAEDIVTPKGLANYRQYLQAIHFYDLVCVPGKIHFIDLVGRGGGVAFLINELRMHALHSSVRIDEKVRMISLNEKKNFDFHGIHVAPEYCTALNLGPSECSLLDQCEHDLRITTSLPGCRWEEDLRHAVTVPYNPGAKKVLELLERSGV